MINCDENDFLKYFFGELVCLPLLFLCRPFCIFLRCLDSNPEGLVNDKIEIVLFLLCRRLDRHVKQLFYKKKLGVQVMRTPGWKELILSDQGLLVEAFDSLAR
jgi:hypothetical protein